MHITRKTMYAIKAMLYIASIKGDKLCTISEISESEKIPREYMAKILKDLSDQGFLSSYRGIQGGYRIKRGLSEVSFLDILEAMQGKLDKELRNEKTLELYKGAAYEFWTDLHEVIINKLTGMKLDKIDFDKFYNQNRLQEVEV